MSNFLNFNMFIIIWKYQVKAEKQTEFEETYLSNGAWAELFEQSTQYIGTELLRNETNHQHYLTIDRWASKEDYEAFLSQYEKKYKALDAQCEGLTESESLLGKWESV